MALHDLVSFWWLIPLALGGICALHLYTYFITNAHLRGIPSPFFAQFTHLWSYFASRQGRMLTTVDELHKKHGAFVRLQPNHVSIADDAAIPIIYGHGSGSFEKSPFYAAFLSKTNNMFTSRNRHEHARKRKIVSHAFSAASLAQFEPFIQKHLQIFVQQFDKLAAQSKEKAANFDCQRWFHFFTFDVISDLAFGTPLNMLPNGADYAQMRLSPESPPVYVPVIEVIDVRTWIGTNMGLLPFWLLPIMRYVPDPRSRAWTEATKNLVGIASALVNDRYSNPTASARKDILTRFMEARDEQGNPVDRSEIQAEAVSQLVAGSDTTSNTLTMILFYATKTPGVLKKLQEEVDAAIPADLDVPTHAMVRGLPYLESVIKETLRIHSLIGIGLQRVVPADSRGMGVTIKGHYFPPGTVLSVPGYTIHHSKEIWGPDADTFRPERWENATQRQKAAFIPFSTGPRACIGRNLAEMELKLLTATWVKRYNIELKQNDVGFRDAFLRKPLGVQIGLVRR